MNSKRGNNIKKCFGLGIRRRRRELDISQEKLAELSGLHRTYVSGIERGLRNPSLENIEKLAIALKISIADLFNQYVRSNNLDE
ncbi:helix-turn-helix domain-containing protein [Oxynema aestuarii]|uniref:Helix-turn-helix transcriptional regulator n=1 Tax=Oxynema aestuarii AP17 TaxID=2064643 RepID=A0A6H1U3C1_9CYAN|nr:helix-turn-helix transcriptional regulator [Oxynema aestuarii]QIZ73334.1 helix-turn-helix transcriptional regulator [Oxynema aestuarii AP17]